jgi:hypothetical protein
MKRFLSCCLALALILSLADSASAKKRRKPFEKRAGDGMGAVNFKIPVTDDGNGFTLRLDGSYQFHQYLHVGLDLGMAADEDSNVVFGNPVVYVGSGLWPKKPKKGWGGYLGADLALGLGLFGVDREQMNASALGMVSYLSWLPFLSEHLVIGTDLKGGLMLGGVFMNARVVPQMAVPVHRTDGRENELAISYQFAMGTGFGDHRGGLFFGIGMSGLSELTTEEQENRYTLDLGIGVRFRIVKVHGMHIGAGLGIPLGGDFMGTNVIVMGTIAYKHSVEIPDEPGEAAEAAAKGWSVPYGTWRR